MNMRPTVGVTLVTRLAGALLVMAACTDESPTGPGFDPVASAATIPAEAVTDLVATAATDSTVTLEWTEVSDGSGRPASYRVKYALPPIDWKTATIGCDRTIRGTQVGARITCTVVGLAAGTTYDFQLMSFRGSWQGAVYSNVAEGMTTVPAPRSAEAVTDLAVAAATDSSLSVRWTQVDDGTGQPARYRVKYSTPTINWSTASIGCDPSLVGGQIGAVLSCTIEGLSAATSYEVQLMSYRLVNGVWEGAVYSNVATGTTSASGTGPGPQASSGSGIWIDSGELMARPTSGAEWDKVLADAARDPGVAAISNQDSNHDVYTLAAALVCVRTGQYCAKARQGVVDAIGTEDGGRWLAVGRNLGAYVIAADLLDLRADGVAGSDGTRVEQWMRGWLTKRLSDNNSSTLRPFGPFHSGANAAAQEGFAYATVAAYLRDGWALERAWDSFRTFACDPTAPDRENMYLDPIVLDGWAHDNLRPCAVNPAGTTKLVPLGLLGGGTVRRVDGSLGGDMRRGGLYQWEPGYTSYPWVGLEGLIPAAVILSRAGYPSFDVADGAVLRTHEYLWYVRTQTGDARWFDGVRAREIVHLVNVVYGSSFPVGQVVGGGRTVGYTGWTHAQR
jgi:flavin-binding protein dodecin